jgi:hypothetical protein
MEKNIVPILTREVDGLTVVIEKGLKNSFAIYQGNKLVSPGIEEFVTTPNSMEQ